jgi:hypothetical protein
VTLFAGPSIVVLGRGLARMRVEKRMVWRCTTFQGSIHDVVVSGWLGRVQSAIRWYKAVHETQGVNVLGEVIGEDGNCNASVVYAAIICSKPKHQVSGMESGDGSISVGCNK